MKAIAAAFAVLVAALCPLIAQSQKPIALVGGTLIDGTGAVPVRNSVVLIRGERIERIGTLTSLPVPSEYERISTEGMTVLPGLWDLHVHLIYSGHPNPGAWFKHAADFERVGDVSVRGKTRHVNVFAVSADRTPHEAGGSG